MTLILESEATQSLALTRSVAGTLREHAWDVTETAFYSRGAIDVAAKRRWIRGELTAWVRLAISCVRSAGRPLIFSELPNDVDDSLPSVSLGDDDAAQRDAIRSMLTRRLDPTAVEDTLRGLHAAAYPLEQALTVAAKVAAPPAHTSAGGFREIDDAGRAVQGAFTLAVANAFASADAIRDDLVRHQIDLIDDDLDVSAAEERSEMAASALAQAATVRELIHPVVITDAPLTILGDAAKITECPWLRLRRASLVAAEPRWIDVVDKAAFPRYSSMLTRHYEARYKQRRFTRG